MYNLTNYFKMRHNKCHCIVSKLISATSLLINQRFTYLRLWSLGTKD